MPSSGTEPGAGSLRAWAVQPSPSKISHGGGMASDAKSSADRASNSELISRRAVLSLGTTAAVGAMLAASNAGAKEVLNSVPLERAVRVTPCATNDLLRNPGKGYILYNLASTVTELWQIAAAGYAIHPWETVQPMSESLYNWDAFDNALRVCRSHGVKLTVGVLCADSSDNRPTDVPLWLFRAGAKYTRKKIWNYLTGKTYEKMIPEWNDPVFLEKLEGFVEAFAKRYDGHPEIEYVENRAYGNWGEWHQIDINTEPATEAVMRQMVDIYANYFTKTRLLIPCNPFFPSDWPELFARYAVDQRGYGLERLGLVTLPDCIYGVEYCYGKSPAKGEWQASYVDFKTTDRWSDEYIDKTFLVGKFSYYNLGYSGNDSAAYLSDKAGQIRYWANRMGYWFRLTEAYFPVNCGNGTQETVILNFRNDGVSPIYVRAWVKLALMDDDYNVLETAVLEEADPFNWVPGRTVTESHGFGFARRNGGTKLAVGLFTDADESNPSIRLGTLGRSNGWIVLNDAVGSDILVHFEDLPVAPPTRLGWFDLENAANGYASRSEIVDLSHRPRPEFPPIADYGGIRWGRGWITWFNRDYYSNGVRFNNYTVYKIDDHFRLPVGTILKSLKIGGAGTVELHSEGNPVRTFRPTETLAAYQTDWSVPSEMVTVYVDNNHGAGQVFFDDFLYGYPTR